MTWIIKNSFTIRSNKFDKMPTAPIQRVWETNKYFFRDLFHDLTSYNYLCVYVSVCVCVRERKRYSVCVCERERKRERVRASCCNTKLVKKSWQSNKFEMPASKAFITRLIMPKFHKCCCKNHMLECQCGKNKNRGKTTTT